MSRIRLLLTVTLTFVLCFSLSAAESNLFDTVCEYPAKNAVYASTSNIVITGWSNRFGGVGVLGLHDRDQVTVQNAGFQIGNDGNWSGQLKLSQHVALSPGDYRILISPGGGTADCSTDFDCSRPGRPGSTGIAVHNDWFQRVRETAGCEICRSDAFELDEQPRTDSPPVTLEP